MFSFNNLLAARNQTTHWDGVRNFVARNFLRDGMKKGDHVFFYHSGGQSAIVGVCEVVREGYPDSTSLDPTHAHFDEKSDPTAPTWFMVDLRAIAPVAHPVSLAQIKARREPLTNERDRARELVEVLDAGYEREEQSLRRQDKQMPEPKYESYQMRSLDVSTRSR